MDHVWCVKRFLCIAQPVWGKPPGGFATLRLPDHLWGHGRRDELAGATIAHSIQRMAGVGDVSNGRAARPFRPLLPMSRQAPRSRRVRIAIPLRPNPFDIGAPMKGHA